MRRHYPVHLKIKCKCEKKGGAANGRLVYGSTGSVIPDAWPILVN
ncbi:hypothetical protein T10_6038 [Trichinella papuae]|uniref:Uncharacterized protein n=1 Tax=Trichinella papuae TaxID=268474 RepID=A0A0V1LYS8_9BILA|nr:hypothetical protein T10_6038 [Trichinella papuae]